VIVSGNAIADPSGNAFAGLSGSSYEFDVVDAVAPAVSSLVPSAGAQGVSVNSDIVLVFNEAVQKGSGDIVLTPAVSGSAVTIAVTSGLVSVSGTTVTVDPSSDLEPGASGQGYTVTVSSGAFEDVSGNAAAGLSGSSYVFTVANVRAPVLVSRSPSDGASDVSLTADVTLTFNENVQVGSGAVVLTPSTSGSAISIDVTLSDVSVSGSVVMIGYSASVFMSG
jgi:methionine-rich copper-binding protein CopC